MIWAIKQRKKNPIWAGQCTVKNLPFLKAKFYIFFGYYFFKPGVVQPKEKNGSEKKKLKDIDFSLWDYCSSNQAQFV